MASSVVTNSLATTTTKRPREDTSSLPSKRSHPRCTTSPAKNESEGAKDRTETAETLSAAHSGVEEASLSSALPQHPQGIKPLGNLYSATQLNLKTHAGSFASLPDELLVHILEQLDLRELLSVGATCKALYAFARHDELWKTLLVESPLAFAHEGQRLQWQGSWRATYLHLPPDKQFVIDCKGLYSDTLYRPFHCAHLPMESYADPTRFRSSIPKLPDLTPEEFKARWVDRPFILTEPVKSWKACREWDLYQLRSQFGSQMFRCEAVEWPMETYAQYLNGTDDESPLYLFDSKFVEKMHLRVGDAVVEAGSIQDEVDYIPPRAFYPDLFTALGDERPSHRWLIIGPPRSGSTFHTDPNGTSAWNAVLKGRKYWIMSPTPPPGVYVSEDESEVTSPSSIAEWLMGFHDEARMMPGVCEGICEEGDVLHVPGGWYHLVLNLPPEDESLGDNIAITQNFVPEPRLPTVLKFLRDKPDQVSGFHFSDDNQAEGQHPVSVGFSAYDLLVERLNQEHPVLLNEALSKIDTKEPSQAAAKSGVWEQVVQQKESGGGGFSFGFGFEDEDDEANA